jgi:thiol:disulfide interchange protein DsbD
MIRKFLFFIFFNCALFINTFSQILRPIEWSYIVDKKQLNVGDSITLIFIAEIEDSWYLYSFGNNDINSALSPTFIFNKSDTYALIDEVIPINPKTKYDSIWEGNVKYFDREAKFIQKISVLSKTPYVSGSMSYQVCSDIERKCIPLESEFNFYSKGPSESEVVLNTIKQNSDLSSLFSFLFFSFLAGLLAILTPCVFPMIPITVSYFANKNNQIKTFSEALFYGISIVLIFTFLGVILSVLVGPQTANELATAWIPNILFFVLFVLFGISLMGFFELTIPSSLITSMDKKSGQGGYLGIFFMAFTLVLVSFSCTGPLIGSILVQSASGLQIKPILGMLFFSIAFAFPFTLLAIFPKALESLPKSGKWMITLRVILGFVVIAFSLKFLSVVDKAYHFDLLNRDIFLFIWTTLFFVLTFYLFGFIKFPEGYVDSLGIKTRIVGLIFGLITIYISSGIFGNKLPLLAAYLPQQQSTYFDLLAFQRKPFYDLDNQKNEIYKNIKYADILNLPHDLQGFFDYDEALMYAKKTNKPLLLDFTGHGCVNCRDIEARVWSEKIIRDILNNKYVLVSLYIDDKTMLPDHEWYISQYDGKIKKSIGKQNADFQITKFNNNAQPFYVVLNPYSENMIIDPIGYELNIKKHLGFLEQGLKRFYDN